VWTVVYVACSRPKAEMIKETLDREGLLVMIRPVGLPPGASGQHEILVPESEVEEAHEVLAAALRW